MTVCLTISFTDSLHGEIQSHAEQDESTINSCIAKACKAYLKLRSTEMNGSKVFVRDPDGKETEIWFL
jgi:hypothetical protein